MAKVSVVTAVYGAKYLREAAESIFCQTFGDFEFHVIDDCSPHDVAGALAPWRDDPRLRLVRNEHNLGLTASLIKGVALARGEYVARLDADDAAFPGRLAAESAFLDSSPGCALVGSNYEIIDERGVCLDATSLPCENGCIAGELGKWNCFGHSTIMFRRACYEAVGGYRRQFKFSQDYDLYLRLAERYDLANIKQPLVKWRLERYSCGMRHSAEQAFYASLARECAAARKSGRSEPFDVVRPACFRESPSATFARYWLNLARSKARAREAVPLFLRSLRYAPLMADNYRFLGSFLKGKFKCW